MRIWSVHPSYLDTKGIVALWRETLLAKHVLEGKTKGYKYHPQLDRFKAAERPLDAINQYLLLVYEEATRRNFSFSKDKVNIDFSPTTLSVTQGQLAYEWQHLLGKLALRDPLRWEELHLLSSPETHPLFRVVEGEIEKWEILS